MSFSVTWEPALPDQLRQPGVVNMAGKVASLDARVPKAGKNHHERSYAEYGAPASEGLKTVTGGRRVRLSFDTTPSGAGAQGRH